MEGPESILEKSSNKLKKILDRYAKIWYNKYIS
jgi:hypothetical protein